jgi:hypothetical protein
MRALFLRWDQAYNTVYSATWCTVAPTITAAWKISWCPKVLGHGFGHRMAQHAPPTM